MLTGASQGVTKDMKTKVIVMEDQRHLRSVGQEYIVTIEETSKSGTRVANIRGFLVLANIKFLYPCQVTK